MKVAKITAKEILECRPCWQEDRVRKAVGRGKTPLQIANARGVSVDDRLWVLTRVLARRNPTALIHWAAGCVQDVVGFSDVDEAMCAVSIAVASRFAAASDSDCSDAARAATRTATATAATAAAGVAYAASDATVVAYYASTAYYASDAAYVARASRGDRRTIIREQLISLAEYFSWEG